MIASSSELIYFLELANTLNFSRASERIGISQPSLSAAIKRLEETIGTPLFLRNKSGVTLTPAGVRLRSHAKQLLQLWETTRAEALSSHHEAQGLIRFGCHTSVALYALPNILSQLYRDYPRVEIQLRHDISRKVLEGIINLSIDIGIVVNPLRHPDIIIKKLYQDKVTLWRSSGKHANQQLDGDRLTIIADPDLMQTQWILKQLQKMAIKTYRLIPTGSLELIAKLTAEGVGVGILPACVATTDKNLKLTAIPKMPTYADEICLVYRHENREIKALQTVAMVIKEHLEA